MRYLYLSICALVFASCGTSNEFAKQKFTDFPKAEPKEYTFNKAEKKTTTIEENASPTIQTFIEETTPEPEVESVMIACVNENVAINNVGSVKERTITTGKTLHLAPFKPKAVPSYLTTIKQVKQIKRAVLRPQTADPDVNTLLLVIIAILLPPLAVFLLDGIGTNFWINLLLTLLFWLPGVIHALYLILVK